MTDSSAELGLIVGTKRQRAVTRSSSASSSTSSSAASQAATPTSVAVTESLDPATLALALRPDGLIDRAVVEQRMRTIEQNVPVGHPFWARAVAEWSRVFQFAHVRAALNPIFTSPPPVRDWETLVRVMWAVAPDCLAQLMRAWPDPDGPTDLVKVMRLFEDPSLPLPVRTAFDVNFTGARRAAKRARSSSGAGVPHPNESALSMEAILATPPRLIIRRAEETAKRASSDAAHALQRTVRAEAEAAAASTAAARLDVEVAGVRRVVYAIEPVAAAATQAVDELRGEVAALRRAYSNADPAAAAAIAAVLDGAERRLQAHEERSSMAERRVAATERALAAQHVELEALRQATAAADPVVSARITAAEAELARHREQVDALRRALASAEPAVTMAVRREVTAAETQLRHHVSLVEDGMRAEVEALRRAVAAAEPASAAPLATALQAAEIRLQLQEERASTSDARIVEAERKLKAIEERTRQEADALRGEVGARLRSEVDALRRVMSAAEPAAAAAIATALADAEARMHAQDTRAAQYEARVAAAESALAGHREELRVLRQRATSAGADASATLRRDMEALQSQWSAELRSVRDAIDDIGRRRGPEQPPPPRNPRAPAFYQSPDGDEPSASGGDDDDDDDDDDINAYRSRHECTPASLDKIEFYLRGPKAIHFWSGNGIGSVPHLTELFKIYWNKFIVGRLSGSDAAQASSMMDALVLACREYERGRLHPKLATALSESVTFMTTKAGYGAYKATVVSDLYRQNLLDPDYRRIVQAAATIVDRGAPRGRIGARYREAEDTRPLPDKHVKRAYSPNVRTRSASKETHPRQHRPPGGRGRGGTESGGRGRGQQQQPKTKTSA